MMTEKTDQHAQYAIAKPWLYYIVLIADIAKWSGERGLAELILSLAYGVADVVYEETHDLRPAA